LGMIGRGWARLGAFGNCLAQLGAFGRFWVLSGAFGHFWALLGAFGCFWALSGAFGHFWALLGVVNGGQCWGTQFGGVERLQKNYIEMGFISSLWRDKDVSLTYGECETISFSSCHSLKLPARKLYFCVA
jgi:hypothetical protein